jgi:hypothetical protein
MLVTERARPKPDKTQIAKLERDITDAKSALEKYDKKKR